MQREYTVRDVSVRHDWTDNKKAPRGELFINGAYTVSGL